MPCVFTPFCLLFIIISFCHLPDRCLAGLSQCAGGNNLRAEVSVVEEQNENSVVENLSEVTRQALERSGLPWRSLLPLRFTLLESNSFFRVSFNETTNESLLLLKNRLDRESLCVTEGTCCTHMDAQLGAEPFEPLMLSSKSDCSLSLILMFELQNSLDFSVEQCILSLTIRILDINDNAPSWPIQYRREKPVGPLRYGGSSSRENSQLGNPVTSVFQLPIREHTKIGTRFELPLAVDPDAYPENTTAHYEIDHNSPNSDLFTLDWTVKPQHISFPDESQASGGDLGRGPGPSTLWLVLNKEIDRDVQSSYQIRIAAIDGAVSKPQTGYLLLNITVEDINDHPPEFEKREDFVWVPEHSPIGSVVYKVKATDRDESDLGKLTYSLAATATPAVSELFTVDPRTGDLRVQGDLDYERQTFYQVPVTVSDGLDSDEAKITIGLININDHPPSVSLHSHLSATKFQSYEMLQRVPGSQLTIEVRENGPPDQLIATFSVADLDDAAEERFLQTDSPVREAFLRNNGINLQQAMERISQPPTCKINSDLLMIQQLAVNANSRSFKSRFQIRLANKALDREVSAKYLIRLECWDQTNRFGNTIFAQSQSRMGGLHHPFARSTSVLFSLVVLDENDSAPKFVGPMTGTIAEGLPVGTLIMQLTAKDADDPYTLGGQAGLRFRLSGDPLVTYAQSYGQNHSSSIKETPTMLQPPSTWFTLDSRTGDLRSSVVFDCETVQSINLTVTVNDGGDEDGSNTSRTLHHNSATTTVQINIQDVNDCAPVFDSPIYELNVSEGATPPLLIGRVHVSDCDSDENNRLLHYWLQQPRSIPPEFSRSEATISSAGKRRMPTVPLLVPTITPSSSSSSARWFTISRSGELYLGAVTQRRLSNSQASQTPNNPHLQDWRPLDREREDIIVLDVCARDHGSPSLTGSAQIIIRLLDINDNSPVWQFPRSNERILNVSLEASVGQKVAQLSATDADEGLHGKVSYSIISGNEEGHFDLDEQTGWLYISKPFHQELLNDSTRSNGGNRLSGANSFYENRLRILSLKTFRLYLRASDGGEPVRSTTAVLDIRLSRPSSLGLHVPPNPQKLTNAVLQKPLQHSTHASPRDEHRLESTAAAAAAAAPSASHGLRGPDGQQLKSPAVARPTEAEDRIGSSESLIVIAVMVAAVTALLFIVIILATACVRRRLYAGSAFTSAASPSLGGDGLPQAAHILHQKMEGKNFGLRFPSLEASSMDGAGVTTAIDPTASKQVLSACMQLPVDHNSTYVTVTRNSLQRNNGALSIRGAPGLTSTYDVHSLENLNGAQNEVLNSYRLAKDVNTPCGFFFQAPTSGVLTVGLSETQLRENSDAESTSLCRPVVQASAETRLTDQLMRRAEKLAECDLAEKTQTSTPMTGLAMSSHLTARSLSSTPANAAYEQLLMSQQLREQSNAPSEDCIIMDTCIPLIPTSANVKVELPSSAQKEGKSLGPLLIKFQPRPDYLVGQPDSRTYTALKFIQESAPSTRTEPEATTASQESSFV